MADGERPVVTDRNRPVAELGPPPMAGRALDAVHIASALTLSEVASFVTYDERQAAAARLRGLRTACPGRP